MVPAAQALGVGSSPRGRGALVGDLRVGVGQGLIPARAGSTQDNLQFLSLKRAHPRAGGEHSSPLLATPTRPGSSPRGRGAQGLHRHTGEPRRLIPARAGSTLSRLAASRPLQAHPRAGGEHHSTHVRRPMEVGSSPRGRGARRVRPLRPGCRGLIPARAGSTASLDRLDGAMEAHPRAGGEHLVNADDVVTRPGSSPRGRGALPPWPGAGPHRGLIPARAGSTRR